MRQITVEDVFFLVLVLVLKESFIFMQPREKTLWFPRIYDSHTRLSMYTKNINSIEKKMLTIKLIHRWITPKMGITNPFEHGLGVYAVWRQYPTSVFFECIGRLAPHWKNSFSSGSDQREKNITLDARNVKVIRGNYYKWSTWCSVAYAEYIRLTPEFELLNMGHYCLPNSTHSPQI